MPRTTRTAHPWMSLLLLALCAIAAGAAHADTDSLGVTDANGYWSAITPPVPQPAARAQQGAAYDPIGKRMILFGGAEYLDDTWSLTLGSAPQWTQVVASPSPSGRKAMSMVYDPVRRRVLMFGGYDGNYRNDVWALSLDGTPVWSQLATSGARPSGRMFTLAVYDPIGDRMIVFGGHPVELNDVWALSLSGTPTWTQLQPAGPLPAPRWGHCGVFDPVNNRLVFFGGTTGGDETWALSLAGSPAWSRIATGGSQPPGRFYATAVYDERRARMILFGGYGANADAWSLSLSGTPAWQRLTPAAGPPAAASLHTAVYDVASDRMVVFNGSGAQLPTLVWAGAPGGPIITGFIPAGGRIGDPVEVFGVDLDNALDITFNGVPAPIRENASDRIATNVPPGATTGLIAVTTAAGKAFSASAFFVGETPVIADATPTSGTPGTLVTITGQHFTATTRVAFGPASHAVFTVLGDDKITATVDEAAETGPILVTTLAATGASSFTFKVIPLPPVIEAVAPLGGRVGDPVRITGLNFKEVSSVAFNGTEAVFTVVSPTEITATVPAGATTGPISVTTAGGTARSSEDFFVGETPVIAAANPDSGKIGAVVVLTGSHFTGATRVAFGPESHAPFTVLADDRLTTVVDEDAVSGPISVTTPAATGTSAFSFRVVPFDTSARIVSVRDVPRDQGGRVTVRWLRSDFDQLARPDITAYRVWRRAPLDGAAAAAATVSPAWRRQVTPAGEVTFWEPLAEIPASHLEGYAYTAATTQDSTEGDNPFTAFFVQTLTRDPAEFYVSPADSGYSVDNLSPSKPPHFTADYGEGGVTLHWGGNTEPDFREYRLYRGAEVGFTADEEALVYAGADTGFAEAEERSCYKLSAVDIHGNESLFALATPGGSTTSVAFAVSVIAQPNEVALDWYVIGLPGVEVSVYRRDPGAAWRPVATMVADGAGMVRYRDTSVTPGQRLTYRLGTLDGDVELFSDEVLVTVPEAKLAFIGLSPNPMVSNGEVAIAFSIPVAGAVSLRLFDAAGRAVLSRDLGWKSAGIHRERLALGAGLSPGIYWLRVRHGDKWVGGKLCLLGS